MTDLKIFKNEKFGEIRVALVNGEPWFIGKDVANVLKYTDTDQALRKHVDEDDKVQRTKADLEEMFKGVETTALEFPNRGLIIINESGFYSLVLSFRHPKAKESKYYKI